MEFARFPSTGGSSVRRIFTFALAVIITALLWVVFASTPTHAAPSATWQGEDTLLFDNHGYVKAPDFKDPTGTIPGDAIVYKSTVQPATEGSPDQKLLVLYFTNGLDPPPDSARYVSFTYKNGEVSNPQGQQSVTVTPADASGNSGSSCSVQGIGWIVCPVSNFLADAMDNIFNMLATFIAVKPMVLGDTSNSMYIAWDTMRSFANIVFVIAFLVIIYSQITSLGLSNYGLKKLIPRLVVAAVLVNLSYYITAVALDVSNVLGYSIQDVFNIIREQTFHLTNDNLSGINTTTINDLSPTAGAWAAVTAAALGAGGYIAGTYFIANGSLYLLIPVLIGLILTAILVLVVLAARQAIIVILVIISPLAFVANLLPNTEKLFEKWKDLFMTMLVFFPAFSLVFGGSQLAGQIIIQNAGDNIIMLIFGMAVQIAPLVITPLILKLSGSLLGRIAQLANNPNKGLLDRSRNWAGKRAELRKHNSLAPRKPFKKLEGNRRTRFKNGLTNAGILANRMTSAPGRPFLRGLDNMGRNLDAQVEAAKLDATNRYEKKNGKYGRIQERKEIGEENKKENHANHARHMERLRTTPGNHLHDAARRAEEAGDGLKTSQENKTAYYNRLRATGGTALNRHFKELATAQSFNKSAEADGAAHLNRLRTTPGTPLNVATDQLLHSEHKAERWNNTYDAYKSKVVLDNKQIQIPGSGSFKVGIGDAARLAASSKEHAETAQTRVQAMFDGDRARAGTVLNTSTVALESAKVSAEGAKANLTEYVTNLKTTKGTALHAEVVQAERNKQAQQISEARLARVIDEYKSGAIDPATLTAREQTLMEQISEDTILLNAEKQGATAAQYETQRNIAKTMRSNTPLADSLLDTAQSVGGEAARVRAKAQAVSTLRKLEDDALGSNVELLKAEAQINGTTVKRWSNDLLDIIKTGGTRDAYGGEITPERIKAAMQAQADERNMGLFESMRGNRNFDQDMISEIISLNVGTFKSAGGFHMQENPDLNITKFASDDAFNEAMSFARVQSLANASADGLNSLKQSWLGNFVNADPTKGATLQDNIDAALAQPDGRKYLRMVHSNLHQALTNPQIRATIGDREDEVRIAEAELARLLGKTPTPDDRPVI